MYATTITASLLAAMPLLVKAWDAPTYGDYNLIWQDNFGGNSGDRPNSNNWNIITGKLGYNSELETYTNDKTNLQLSGGYTLQIAPERDSNGDWTSGRIESRYTFVPAEGKRTLIEADIRFGSNSINNKAGIWPAFWMLGDSGRHGTAWPNCGEVDAMEQINGALTGYGTLHCDVVGGKCNDPSGIQGWVSIPDQDWHSWRVVFDRTNGDWTAQTITWYRDGQQFHQVSGGRVGDYNAWAAVCHSSLYFIFNVAVGGSWPEPPNDSTIPGFGSMMEVGFLAVHNSK